jgi:hypothetical protein
VESSVTCGSRFVLLEPSREFGVRIALGASSRQLVSSVISESFRLIALDRYARPLLIPWWS